MRRKTLSQSNQTFKYIKINSLQGLPPNRNLSFMGAAPAVVERQLDPK